MVRNIDSKVKLVLRCLEHQEGSLCQSSFIEQKQRHKTKMSDPKRAQELDRKISNETSD